MRAAKVRFGDSSATQSDQEKSYAVRALVELPRVLTQVISVSRSFYLPNMIVFRLVREVLVVMLALSAAYVLVNEGRDNWQSLWTCAIYLLFALTLWRARAEQSRE